MYKIHWYTTLFNVFFFHFQKKIKVHLLSKDLFSRTICEYLSIGFCLFICDIMLTTSSRSGHEFQQFPQGQDTPDTYNPDHFIRRPNLNQSDSISSSGGLPPLNPVSEFTSLSRPDPKYADYSLKQKRVESYRNWPPSAKQKPENLVDAGFFYTGD